MVGELRLAIWGGLRRSLSESERERITRESVSAVLRAQCSICSGIRGSTPSNWREFIEFEGWDEFARTVGPTGPCIIAACHYGNFEWFSLAAAYAGLVATIVSQEFKNSLLDPIFNQLRQQSGHQFVPREGAVVKLYKALRRGGTAAILVDLTLHPRQPSVAIDCFGMKMSVTYAHAWLQFAHRLCRSSPVHQSRCPAVVAGWSFIPNSKSQKERTSRRLRNCAGSSSNPSSCKILRPGSGCTNTGVIDRRMRPGPTRIIPIRCRNLTSCWQALPP